MKRTHCWSPISLLCAFALPACGGNTTQQGDADDVGESVEYVVIEGGFACPTAMPARFEVGDFEICMQSGDTPTDLPRETCELLGACKSSAAADATQLANQSADVEATAAGSVDATSGAAPFGDAASIDGTDEEAPVAMEAVGPRLLPPSSDTLGIGDCAETSVADVAALVAEAEPDLAGITEFVPDEVYDAPPPAPGDDVYYAIVSETSIFLAFRRCLGEVVQGECDDVRLDFFTTEDGCVPVAAGSYRATLTSEACYDVSGEASEEFPELAVRDRDRCDFDPMPETVAGTFSLLGLGTGSFCEQALGDQIPLDLSIVQDASDLSSASVTVSNSGFDCVDDQSFPASVIMDVVDAELPLSETSTSTEAELCAPPAKIVFTFGGDWGGLPFIGSLDYYTLDDDGCGELGPQYTPQGYIHLTNAQ